jgi:hypothetical protein
VDPSALPDPLEGHMARSELFHVGIVVPDIEAARAHLTALLGIRWGPVIETDNPFRWADGTDVTVAGFQLCYSLDGPHLELITEQPGTPWVCNEHSNLHHIGFFADSVEQGSQRLSTGACPLEIAGWNPESGALGWTYHRDPLGVRIEIIDVAIASVMSELMLEGVPLDVPANREF